jgi:hypothetical protein
MAAESAMAAGASVDVFDAMPSAGRKFLLAGKGGLNLTHSEPSALLLSRYGSRRLHLAPFINAFGPEMIRAWASGLGVKTFVGTSRRVFPEDLKAAPLLRAWLRRLRMSGVRFHMRHRWLGWDEQRALRFVSPAGERSVAAPAVILALGGASWPRLGSDGAWVRLLAARGVEVAPLQPANCGFDTAWSGHFRAKFAGQPVKSVNVTVRAVTGESFGCRGDFIITETGLEGGVVYTVSSCLRNLISRDGKAVLYVDLAPERDRQRLIADLAQPRGKKTVATHWARRAGIEGVKAGLLREVLSKHELADPVKVAETIKALPVTVLAPRPLEEAISTAGGVTFDTLDDRLMFRAMPGVFCAGEMLDWEAPTGGYLLTACLATGRAAGLGAVVWLKAKQSR